MLQAVPNGLCLSGPVLVKSKGPDQPPWCVNVSSRVLQGVAQCQISSLSLPLELLNLLDTLTCSMSPKLVQVAASTGVIRPQPTSVLMQLSFIWQEFTDNHAQWGLQSKPTPGL